MPVDKTTSPAWDLAFPKDHPENSAPSSSTSAACFAALSNMITFLEIRIPIQLKKDKGGNRKLGTKDSIFAEFRGIFLHKTGKNDFSFRDF
jgi:hypothetical protein